MMHSKHVLILVFLLLASSAQAFSTSISDVLIFTEINDVRQEHDREELIRDATLDVLAQEKLDDMFARNYFSHKDPNGLGTAVAAKNAGYRFTVLGENLAMGSYDDIEMLVDAWMESSGHRKNLLDDRFTNTGIASGIGEFNGEETFIAVQIFARPHGACKNPSAEIAAYIARGETYTKNIAALMSVYATSMGGASNGSVRALTNQVSVLMTVFLRSLDEKIKEYDNQIAEFEACMGEG